MTATRFPDDVKTLGEAIRFIREQRNMSLRALARDAGVSAPFLSDVEHGRRSTDRIPEFARVLGCDEEELRRFDARLTPELRDWISSNPSVIAFLRELRESGTELDAARAALAKLDEGTKTKTTATKRARRKT